LNKELTDSIDKLNFGSLDSIKRFSGLLDSVRNHIRTTGVGTLTVDSTYWAETDGLIICKKKESESTELDEIEVQGKIYLWQLKPYKDEWQIKIDPTDNKIYQEKMDFKTYLETVVWPNLSDEKKNEIKTSVVQDMNEEERKKFLVNSVNINGNLIDCNGKELEAGLQMFVISEEDNTLYIGKKNKRYTPSHKFLSRKTS